MVPCGSREAVVTVISYENGIMSGYLQHPRLDKKEKLQSLSQMVLLLNSLMDLENCPNPPPPFVHPEYNEEEGKRCFAFRFSFGNITHCRGSLYGRMKNVSLYFTAYWNCFSC